MFCGESVCLAVYFLFVRNRDDPGSVPSANFSVFWLMVPAVLDACGSSLMYIGLALTYSSVYQMLRGTSVFLTGLHQHYCFLFTRLVPSCTDFSLSSLCVSGLFSVLFLERRLFVFHWFGMLLVLGGCAVVGVASVLFQNDSVTASNPLTGDIIIVLAQFLSAAVCPAVVENLEERGDIWEEQLLFCYSWLLSLCLLRLLFFPPSFSLLRVFFLLRFSNMLSRRSC